MKQLLIASAMVFFSITYAGAEQTKLTLYPVKVSKEMKSYTLVPQVIEPNCDARQFYEKAADIISKNPPDAQVREWCKTSLDKFPVKNTREVLDKYKEVLDLAERGARCGKYKWPLTTTTEETLQNFLSNIRKVTWLLGLKFHLQMAQGQYEQALPTLQTAFGAANHLCQDSDLIQKLVGFAIAGFMLHQVEWFIQQPNAPCLYWALQTYPKSVYGFDTMLYFELPGKSSMLKRLQRHIAALQCIEALRIAAGADGGKWPERLEDVKKVAVPVDPVSGKAFIYKRDGAKAILQEPEKLTNGTEKDVIAFQLDLREKQ